MDAAELDQALRAASIPFVSCTVGVETDRTTWRVEFPASATAAQRQQAADLIASYVPKTAAQLADDAAQREVSEKKLQAVALALWECIPAPTMTKAQMKTRAIAIFKTL